MGNIFDIFNEISAGRTAKSNLPVTHIIVGLGNPGEKYANTRHNAGFRMLEYLSERCGIRVDSVKFKALVGDGEVGGRRVLLMKPQTYMNHSGEAVAEAAHFYKIPPENIIVFSDDVSLDVGAVRMRKKGSDGGQKGLRSIVTIMGTQDFPRIKFGVGAKPHPDYDMADWVVSEFTKEEKVAVAACFPRAFDGVVKYLAGDPDGAVQACNSKVEK